MAEVLASALIGIIVKNLANEALRQYGLLAGLNTELENLSRTFTIFQGVLCDAERKQWNSGSEGEAVKTWLRQLKDAAYGVDDVLDEFHIEVERRQRQKGLRDQAKSFFSLHHNPIAFRLEMAHKLKSAREKLDVIYEKQPPGLHVGSTSSPPDVLEWRLTTSLINDSKFYGRVDQKKKLINDLVYNSEAFSIHALCGIGGLGKTALAQSVYNDETIKTSFPLRIWVCVSDDTDIKRLTRAIIESIGGDTSSNEQELDSLQRLLRDKLSGTKFLLVLDDVWEDFNDKWDGLENAVTNGAIGSAVLITTRIQKVAEKICTAPIQQMERLSDEESWLLFVLHAFRNGRSSIPFEKFRKDILKKCGGVPLVLKVLGSLMQLKKEENDWSDVMGSELWDLPDEGKKILATLRLSYTHLPMNLRQCFSYCCIFPKDYVMEKEVLIQIWMANDFIISSGERKGLHETGKEIFNELVARSFFQNIEMDYSGNITCKMHDLLHLVATSVMQHELQLIQRGECLEGGKNYRHVSAFSNEIDDIEKYNIKGNCKIPSLRSFIFFSTMKHFQYDGMIDDGKNVELLSTQKYLRILKLDCLGLEKLPMSLSQHLRYLDLSRSSIRRLPESICSLYKLQTLNLGFCMYLEQLPKGMKEMKSILYLDVRGCRSLKGMPAGISQLKGMRKLSKFIVGKKDGCKIGELKELNGLEGELSISSICNVKSVAEAESANLMEKKMLTSLELIAGTSSKFIDRENDGSIIDMEILSALQPHQNLRKLEIEGYGSLKLPIWMMDLHVHLPHLVKIVLLSFSRCQQLQIPLGRLDSLKSLRLGGMSCLKHIGVEMYGDGVRAAFPSLDWLILDRMESLKEWAETITTAFPCLRRLVIDSCPLLTKFPIISSLQDLSLRATTSQLMVLVQANFISLKSLRLYFCHELESLPELNPRHNVCSLEHLTIFMCTTLKSLPNTGLWCSSSLRYLVIRSCDELTTLSEDGLRHLTVLQTLRIIDCQKMTSLPESIQHLTALQTLKIVKCNGLYCLPDGIRSLTNLAELYISECPYLGRRCEKEKGEDWPKIAHINSICISEEKIDSDWFA